MNFHLVANRNLCYQHNLKKRHVLQHNTHFRLLFSSKVEPSGAVLVVICYLSIFQVAKTAHPPMYLKCDLETFDTKSLEQKFDVILIEPPLVEYARSYGVTNVKFWDWDKVRVYLQLPSLYFSRNLPLRQIMALDIGELAANRSFIFLWCGSSDGLDLGRLCLQVRQSYDNKITRERPHFVQ